MTPDEARRRFVAGRVARLSTVDGAGQPHLVPIVYAVMRSHIYSAVDGKPKRSAALRRLANVTANPRVAVLLDHYDDNDWDQLWWVRADGTGRVLAADGAEAVRAIELLRERYPQYRIERPAGPVLAVDVRRWSGWAARDGG